MATPDDVGARLLAVFAERLNVAVPAPDTELIESGVIDSLQFVELLAALEEEFGIAISLADLDIDNFRTLRHLAAFLARRRDGERSHGAASPLTPPTAP